MTTDRHAHRDQCHFPAVPDRARAQLQQRYICDHIHRVKSAAMTLDTWRISSTAFSRHLPAVSTNVWAQCGPDASSGVHSAQKNCPTSTEAWFPWLPRMDSNHQPSD